MTAASNHVEQAVLNAWFRNTSHPSAPATVYVALYTTATNDGTGGTEVTGGSYARVAVSTSGGFSEPGNPGVIANLADIEFPTASADWGEVTHVAIMSASSGGTRYWHGPINEPVVVASGRTVRIPAGMLTIGMD